MNRINKKLLSEHFLCEIKNETLKCELSSLIYETMKYKEDNNITQKQWSVMQNVSLSTVRRIELGKCYDLKLISKYINNE